MNSQIITEPTADAKKELTAPMGYMAGCYWNKWVTEPAVPMVYPGCGYFESCADLI